ncbi:RNA polymerase II transcription factor B subunit 1 [Pseudocyphellaria aurata]|nr:RNA polymerase II transcription factor B subunit 1 [Pseudocyphellaria aurata]
MARPRGSAAYKKIDGTLAIVKDGQAVSWTPVAPPGSKPTLTLHVSSITNLQQTPATSAKVMLKVFALTQGASASEQYVFSFTSPTTARAEADAIKDALSKAIQAAKAGSGVLAPPGGASAAMTIASAVTSLPPGGGNTDAWYDDSRLKSDVQLQQSLLKSNTSLSKTFMESLRTKPESITNSQFTDQFWSTRIHLLRAHVIEKNQTRGAYNVLSSFKPTTVDGTTKLSISKEQIQLIFNQHSLVKRVYDENVPRLSEEAFWSRFFQSRLFKKLKGEKISEHDTTDNILDRYLQHDEDEERGKRLAASHVPRIIDVEGNEENHSQRKGNQADVSMRPAPMDRVPIIRTLNSLSEKIMVHVPPNDIDPSLPIGVDEETFNTLALRDLQADAEENRVVLNVKDQSRFFSSNKETGVSADAVLYAKQDPAQVLRTLKSDVARLASNPGLESAIGVDNDSSDEESQPKKGHVGSKASLAAATAQILAAVSQQRAQTDDLHASAAGFSTALPSSTFGLSVAVFDRLSLTHATTTEFLQHFWSAFLSGDADRADEISRLVETFNRAMDRIKAVADDADQERTKEVEKVEKQLREQYARTKRKMKFDFDSIGGGAKAVNQLLGPTIKAIKLAGQEYKKALAASAVTEEDEIT